MKLSISIIFAIIFCFQSCKNSDTNEPREILKDIAKSDDINIGNLNFQFDLPRDWSRIDTVLQSLYICLLKNDDDIYKPRINITTESMHGKNHSNYVLGTKQYLTNNMTGIQLLEDGKIDISGKNCIWYSYNKTQNGMKREMIYYSIANSEISYNITVGLNPGGIRKYKQTIDKIVKSFRLN